MKFRHLGFPLALMGEEIQTAIEAVTRRAVAQ